MSRDVLALSAIGAGFLLVGIAALVVAWITDSLIPLAVAAGCAWGGYVFGQEASRVSRE